VLDRQRRMDTRKVVVHVMQTDRVRKVLHLL
jgi:hypothetical protein